MRECVNLRCSELVIREKFFSECWIAVFADGLPQLFHEIVEEMDIMNGEEAIGKHFIRFKKMTDVGFAEMAAGISGERSLRYWLCLMLLRPWRVQNAP